MKILALSRELPGVTAEQYPPLLKEEARHAWGLYQRGVVREIYFREDIPEVVLVMECASLEEAGAVLAKLPLAEAGLITFDLIPLRAYDGFARLFA